MPDNTYGQRFRELWRRRGLSRPDLLRRLDVHTATLSNMLKQAEPPKLETLLRDAHALRVRPSELLHDVVTVVDRIRRGDYDSRVGRHRLREEKARLPAASG